jgi:predicted SnoaL-like aldol condensation-catalyzing enzyme
MDHPRANELVRRVFAEVIDGGDYSLIPLLFTDDFQDHGPMGDTRGHDAFIATLEGFRAALPGFRHEIEDVILVGEETAVFHVRVLAGFDLWFANAVRFRDGKVVEHWGPGPEASGRLLAAMGLEQPAVS